MNKFKLASLNIAITIELLMIFLAIIIIILFSMDMYITKVDDMEFETELSKKPKGFSEDFDGKLLAWAFAFEPSDEQFIELDMDNIDTISIVKR